MRKLSTFSLVIASFACSAPETQVTRLTPDVTVAPGEVLFGDVVPSFSIDRTIQIVNAGRTTLEISDISLSDGSDGFSFEYEPQLDDDGVEKDIIELERSESLPINVFFAPEDLVAYGTNLVILSNDEDTPSLEVPVSGTGVIGPQPDISVNVDTVDFGTVTTGATSTEYVLVRNEGDGALEIYDTWQSGSGAFSVVTDPAGQSIAPASEATVLVTYTPDGGMSGHAGTLTFVSNDADEPEVSVELIGGDGGPDTSYPLAVISADDEVNPPELVALDGSGSSDPADEDDEYDLVYSWSIADQPLHSFASISDPTATSPFLDIDVAGDYTVQLIVTDFLGVTSAPTQHTVRARPVEDLYIALTWDKSNADMDLHVVPNGGFFWGADDLSFCHTELDWGEDGVGTHGGDVSDGFGPETVLITDLAETSYHMGVHYYEDNGGASVEATVTVYLNGEPHETISRVLVHNYFWTVGYTRIEEGEGMFVASDEAPYFSSLRECSE